MASDDLRDVHIERRVEREVCGIQANTSRDQEMLSDALGEGRKGRIA